MIIKIFARIRFDVKLFQYIFFISEVDMKRQFYILNLMTPTILKLINFRNLLATIQFSYY
jgi:hypothetical protein